MTCNTWKLPFYKAELQSTTSALLNLASRVILKSTIDQITIGPELIDESTVKWNLSHMEYVCE